MRLIALLGIALAPITGAADLADEQDEIQELYPGVEHIGSAELEATLVDSETETILFDVREQPEFAISHLKGAIQIDPDLTGEEFLSRFANRIENRRVVFYCSVGYRSSQLAQLVQARSEAGGAAQILNLRHGLFGWHNEKRQLVRGESPTDAIHPYDFWWGRFLERRHLSRYELE